MSDLIDTPPAVFDPGALVSLTGHADDEEFALVLAGRYLRLLPERVRRVHAALHADDPDEAMDAVLSLKVSSNTVGAHEIATIGAAIERHLRRVDLPGAHRAAGDLPPAAERLAREISAYLAV
ncbi:Hpt domain-containing protein [Nocardioides sp.]|uniref:Hpt domain-containing protein n=1 Tax=Nocardioides sp. TaxID=35761 RepID=UPI0025E27589|nr:Hpt domain-containing protein [Nocardioides sp.]